MFEENVIDFDKDILSKVYEWESWKWMDVWYGMVLEYDVCMCN